MTKRVSNLNMDKILFNRPHLTGNEQHYIAEALMSGHLSGDGPYTKKCHRWLEQRTGCSKALLTHSCTAALEMAALLLNIQPGDEVIMPSYTFVSTANAFVLRGAVPVFVDIREDTLNIDEKLIESSITERTKAIVPVHYAGVACEMDAIVDIARRYELVVIEDAAQGVMAKYKGRELGSIGDLGAFSFHETKNIISGEGGALIVNNAEFSERAEVIREKGTNRSRFLRGQVDKYTWEECGSSYLASDIIAAFLWAQLEDAENITQQRLDIWNQYHDAFGFIEKSGRISRPFVPKECGHNAHMYYLKLNDLEDRTNFISEMSARGVICPFHYIPLHLSPAGNKFSKKSTNLSVTRDTGERIVRLPLWVGMGSKQEKVIESVISSLRQ